jgi:hypothetical protein
VSTLLQGGFQRRLDIHAGMVRHTGVANAARRL